MGKILEFLVKILPTSLVVKMYVESGTDFGDAVSYLYMGECIGFKGLFNKWAFWEREYARRGYATIDLDSFVDAGGWGKELPSLRVLRDGKEAVLHAEIYRERFLGKPIPIEARQVEGGAVAANYVLPSTRTEPTEDGGPYR